MNTSTGLAAAGIVLVLVLAYVGAYFAMLAPSGHVYLLTPYPATTPKAIDRPGEYRFGGRFAQLLFWPANAVDRLVRPSYWTIELSTSSSGDPDA